jgi:flagellar hook-basal body complex protein FliE
VSLTISPIQGIPVPASVQPSRGAGESGAFQSVLEGAVRHLDESQRMADQAVDGFLNGSTDDLHTTALAVQRSELELEMALQVRNKVVQAYQEIMRLQV